MRESLAAVFDHATFIRKSIFIQGEFFKSRQHLMLFNAEGRRWGGVGERTLGFPPSPLPNEISKSYTYQIIRQFDPITVN